MENLLKQIEGLIIEKSLSLGVIEIVRKIQAEHATMTEKNKTLEETIKLKDEQIKSLSGINEKDLREINSLLQQVNKFKEREKEFIDSEHTIALKDKDVTGANNTLSSIKDIIGMVFKNTVIRESVCHSESGSNNQGYYNNTVSDTKEIIKE